MSKSDDDAAGPRRRGPPRPPRDSVALDPQAPRVTLPDDAVAPVDDKPRSTRCETPLDAWNQDLLRRSSPPPAVNAAALWSAGRITPEPTDPSHHSVSGPSHTVSGPSHTVSGPSHTVSGDAFDLVRRSSPHLLPVDLATEMAERFALDDFSGALRAAQFLLGKDPDDASAAHYARASREKLEQLLLSRLTREGTIPEVQVREDEVRWLGLDPHASGLLARVDGTRDCAAILQAAGTGRLEALQAMLRLLECGAIRLRGRSGG